MGVAFNRFDDVRPESAPRLLQILPRLDAVGASRNAIDIARGVIAAGGAVVAAAGDGAAVAEFRRAGGVHVALPLDGLSPLARWRGVARLRAAVARHRIDVIHAYGVRGARLARRVSRATGVPFVVSPMGEDARAGGWFVREMGAARAVVAASEFVASLVPQEMRDAGMRVEIVPRGVDLGRFDPATIHAEKLVRQSQAWRSADLSSVILMPGQLDPARGQDVLLYAVARMATRDATCLILSPEDGNAEFRERLLALIESLGLGGRVRFVGYAPDMAAAYMIADVVVFPAREPEAFNNSLAEALAMGRPVVAADAGGAADLVIDGRTGWLVPPGDPDALAAALDSALALDEAGRAGLARSSREHIRRHFCLASVQQRMLGLYRDVALSGTTPGGPAA